MAEFAEGMPTATVKLDKPREIGFTLGALRRVKEKLGRLDFDLAGAGASMALPTYVWACLPASGRKELTIEQVEDLIHPGNMNEISDALGVLFKASTPDPEANPTGAAPATPAAAE
jgi:hypothetical protein